MHFIRLIAILRLSPRKHFLNMLLLFFCFLPFLRFSAFPFYFFMSAAFCVPYIFFEAPRVNEEGKKPLSSAHKLYLLFFYTGAGAGLGALSAVVYWENRVLTVMAALIFLSLFCLSFLKRNFTRKLLSIAFLVLAENLILFFFPEPLKTFDYEKIKNQKFVAPLFWFTNEAKPSSMKGVLALPKQAGSIRTMVMTRDEKQLYVILHGPPVPHRIAVKLPVKNILAPLPDGSKFAWLSAKKTDNAGARDMALDDMHHTLYILGINGTVFQVDTNTFKVKHTFSTGMKRMVHLFLLKDKQSILLLPETGNLKKYRLPSWKLMQSAETDGNVYALLPARDEKVLFIVQWGKSTILEMNLNTLKVLREIRSAPYYPVGADLSEQNHVLYFTDYVRGQLFTVDTRDFSIADSFKVKRGLREARWDKKRKLLYMGNFQKGELYIFDVKKRKIIRELFLGKKLRHIYITPKTNQVLAATRYGIFRIDVDAILRANSSKKKFSR